MSIEAAAVPDHPPSPVVGDHFVQITDTLALYVAGEDVLPPDTCPELVPHGWVWTGEVADFEFRNGDWREVYILESE